MAKQDTRRVKLYKMRTSGDWDDKGTGHVRCVFLTKQEGPCIVVKSEEDDSELLRTKISSDDRYNRQQDTLIVWNEPDSASVEGVDLALSFQDHAGCSELWEEIRELQQYLLNPDYELEKLSKYKDLEYMRYFILPPAEITHLDEIFCLLTKRDITAPEKQLIASSLLKEQYLPKLILLWKQVKTQDNKENCVKMYYIFKDIILLNNIPLLEQVVSSNNIIEIMSALEYDPEPYVGTIKHSEFLQNQIKYKQVVPLNNPSLENKIHQTYRLQYLKDVALARALDEPTYTVINTLVCINNINIITEISENEDIIKSLFTKLKELEVNQLDIIKDHLSFLLEMCDMIRNLEPKNKSGFYQLLFQNDLFEVIEKTIVLDQYHIRMISAQVLLYAVEHDTILFRVNISQHGDYSLLKLLIHRTDVDPETGVRILLFDVLKHLCDTTTLDRGCMSFLNVFYQKFAPILFSPLSRPLPRVHSEEEAILKNHLCELLAIFVQHHDQWISSFLSNPALLKNIINLVNSKERWLALSTVKFFRAFLSVENHAFRNIVITENLFEQIVELFLKNGNKYNLIESAILELFEWVVKKNIKPIVKYLMEKYYDTLNTVPLPIFQQLKELHEKNDYTPVTPEETSPADAPVLISDIRQRTRQRFGEERAEEDWFNSENDDDDDDEDYTPTIYFTPSPSEFKERTKKRPVEGNELEDLAFNNIKEKKLKKSNIIINVGEKRNGVKNGENKS